jgi:YD repeat-containing protein
LQNCFGYTSWDLSAPQEENQVQQYWIDEVQDITREGVHGSHGPRTDLNFSYPAWVRYFHYVTNPSGTTETLEGNQSANMWNAVGYGGPIMNFTDKDGTYYSFDNGVSNRLHSVQNAVLTTYGYDNWGNVTSETVAANDGSGSISRSAVYPGNCTAATLVTCTKPTSITDANQNTTLLKYDPAHGGITRQTDPAVGGVTPEKRYGYIQRYAWYFQNGTMTKETRPVWLLSTESYCRTSSPNSTHTGCTTADDEVVTTYDYGPDSGPNNLLLRGQTVTSAGITRRTCFGHDKYGNKIWEQAPNANASSCPSY